jgi:allantoinase
MPDWDLLIRGGVVVTPQGVSRQDVAVSNEKIVSLAAKLSGSAAEEIDATGLHVFPGLIDAHVHFNEPGRADWEGFSTGSSALAAGGGTCFFDMPLNASPPTLDGNSFDLKRRAAEKSSFGDFALWGGLTPGNLDSLEELAGRGVIGFKAFMCDSGIDDFPCADDLTLHRGMTLAAKLGLPVAVHAENQQITHALAMEARQSGRTGIQDYLDSRPVVAELEAIRRAISLAEDTGCALHIVHVSSPDGICIVNDAKKLMLHDRQFLDVTCETCPHYLAMSSDDMEELGAIAKCAPPLREAGLAKSLCKLAAYGQIDMIGSDHSPSPESMKQSANFFDVWGGIAGVQSTLSILLSMEPSMPLERISQITAAQVAKRFGLAQKGRIAAGLDADLALIDLGGSHTLSREHLLDRHKLSPYIGRTFRGIVKRTLLRGRTIYRDGKVVGQPSGKLLTPQRRPRHA